MHPVEECTETLAFATEPVFASLANILAFQVRLNGGGGGGEVMVVYSIKSGYLIICFKCPHVN